MTAAPLGPFAALWASQAFSNLADGLLHASAPLLVATLTQDPLVVAGLTVAQFLPWLLVTLPAGALADRVDRRRILVAGNWLRAGGFALLALSLTAEWSHVGLLYAAVFLAGCAETMVDNAALAIPPRLLPRARLERANGRLFATQSVINTFIGPPAGAALFALAASAAFYTGAAAFALAGLAALLLPALRPAAEDDQNGAAAGDDEHGAAAGDDEHGPAAGDDQHGPAAGNDQHGPAAEDDQHRPAAPTGFVRDIGVGWAHFWRHALLRRVAFLSAAINFFGACTGGLLVLLVTGPYGLPASSYGWFVAVPAAGAIVGSLLAARVVPRIGGGATGWLAALTPAAGYAVLGLSHSTPLALTAMFAAAVASSLNQIVVSTLRQAAVPDELLGRVTAAYRLIVLGAVPFGALTGGLLGRALGIRAAFLTAALGLALAAVPLASRVTTRALRDAEKTPPAALPVHAGTQPRADQGRIGGGSGDHGRRDPRTRHS
ncbi:MFS transporter [Streptomyces sp. NPDC007818]|uniref:MFS transporter n=1 Tax=Streptomyces sp. NPDC007818 TaxID=3364780 RepID=UPI0036CF9BBA